MMWKRAATAGGVGLLLADVSIVVLALPELLSDLQTSIEGVAAVLFVYLAVLAVATPLAARLPNASPRLLAGVGFVVAAVASGVAGAADTLPVLIAARVVGAAGAGCAVAGGFVLVDGAGRGRSAWRLAALASTAIGPALGGVLTQAFSWRAIFLVQVPVLLVAALAAGTTEPAAPAPGPVVGPDQPGSAGARRLELALALVSASLSGAVFLLVLVLVAGWNLSPLGAAVTVSVLPCAALLAGRVRAPPRTRAIAGCALTGSGALALAWLPQADAAWAIAPQLLAGAGAGLALPALSGDLLPERNAAQAARLLAIRSAAIAIFLLAIGPVVASRLESGLRDAKLKGIALVLDARLSPQAKFRIAPRLFAAIRSQDVRASLDAAFAQQRHQFQGDDRVTYDRLGTRAEELVLGVVQGAFEPAFIIAGALGLLAAPLAAWPISLRLRRQALVLGSLLVVVPLAYAVASSALAPPPVVIAAPCRGGPLPGAGGLSGFLQDRALQLVDTAACQLHTTREELVLAAADPAEGRRFATRHGVDPHTLLAPLMSLLGGP